MAAIRITPVCNALPHTPSPLSRDIEFTVPAATPALLDNLIYSPTMILTLYYINICIYSIYIYTYTYIHKLIFGSASLTCASRRDFQLESILCPGIQGVSGDGGVPSYIPPLPPLAVVRQQVALVGGGGGGGWMLWWFARLVQKTGNLCKRRTKIE